MGLPIEKGYYWHRVKGGKWKIAYFNFTNHFGRRYSVIGNAEFLTDDIFSDDEEWIGPITEPKSKKNKIRNILYSPIHFCCRLFSHKIMDVQKELDSNPDLEYIDARDLGNHPLCDVWLDGKIQGNNVVEMLSHRLPDIEIDGAIKLYVRDKDGLNILKDGGLMITDWKSGKVKWSSVKRKG